MSVKNFRCQCGHTTEDHSLSGECLIYTNVWDPGKPGPEPTNSAMCGCQKMRPQGEEIVRKSYVERVREQEAKPSAEGVDK